MVGYNPVVPADAERIKSLTAWLVMGGRAVRAAALPNDSTDLCRFGLLGRRILYGPQIEVEQRLLFVALVLILFAQAKDFLQHFYVEALSFGLGKDFLLALIQRLKFFVDVLDALDERQNTITRNSNRVGHAVPLCDGSKGYGGEGCREVNAFVLIPSDFTLLRFSGLASRLELGRNRQT